SHAKACGRSVEVLLFDGRGAGRAVRSVSPRTALADARALARMTSLAGPIPPGALLSRLDGVALRAGRCWVRAPGSLALVALENGIGLGALDVMRWRPRSPAHSSSIAARTM